MSKLDRRCRSLVKLCRAEHTPRFMGTPPCSPRLPFMVRCDGSKFWQGSNEEAASKPLRGLRVPAARRITNRQDASRVWLCAMRYSDNRLQWWYSVIFASTANHRDQHYRLSEHLKFPVTSEIRAGLPLGGFACEADNHAFGCHYSERNDGRTRANSRGTASVHE